MKAFNELSIKDQGRELMQVELTPLTVAALDNYLEWSKDKEVVDFIGGGKELSAEEIENRFQQILRSENDFYWSVILNGKNVGHVSFHNIDPVSSTAEVGILLGEKSIRSLGVGAKALRLMELKGRELKLNKLIAEIDNSNVKSIRLFESSGFSFVRDLPDMGAKIYEKAIK